MVDKGLLGCNGPEQAKDYRRSRVFLLYFVTAERESPLSFSCLSPGWRLIPSSKARGCAVINDYKVFRTDDYQSAPDAPAVPLHNFRDFDVRAGSCFPYPITPPPHSTPALTIIRDVSSIQGVKKELENLKEHSKSVKEITRTFINTYVFKSIFFIDKGILFLAIIIYIFASI